MEHQVFVPVPADSLRAVLRDPVRVARCVPGLQQDADTDSGPVSGRLKVRVGGSTVTYRGALTVTERDPGRFDLDGEGTEVRGSGTVTLSLVLRLLPREDGTRLDFTAGGTAEGRAAAFTAEATASAVRRLLDRAAELLAAAAAPGPADTAAAPGTADTADVADAADTAAAPGAADVADAADAADAAAAPGAADAADAEPGPGGLADPVAQAEEAEEAGDAEGSGGAGSTEDEVTEVTASVFDTEVPPPSLDPFLSSEFDELDGLPRPPAEAAHARRTMIGRSAEEVDHAPPRGRYAPVPAPTATSAADSLRWIAPAAALALASAVVLGRALRRRR
ncbi:SRPBCC domain-containing protein [Streptomyces sp. ISL-94]|uniref:SRPBCC domain-containing protein n=1 Tax=Streptomyces sp. ISL-94 TaxID=2819190 RepID=UPI001BE96C42|nr:SRPBCC domain-containing protein [Streptomyces sp. ISL-94]MBT2478699.1 SRPBCC family protein [Streptomyces sp. ISL-94]